MNAPVTTEMKEFVESMIEKVTAEHSKILSGWKNVDLNDENLSHLFKLFKKCDSSQIRLFEEKHFLGDEGSEIYELIRKELSVGNVTEKLEKQTVKEELKSEARPGKSSKKKKKKKNDDSEKQLRSIGEDNKQLQKEEREKAEEVVSETSDTVSNEPIQQSESDKPPPKISEEPQHFVEKREEEVLKKPDSEQRISESESTVQVSSVEKEKRKNRNPFDNEKLFIEPLIHCTPNIKEFDPPDDGFDMQLPSQYISSESDALKLSLKKLATDISTEEQHIRARLECGDAADMENEVLADFINRANTVLKETEAVTVRKIAEAETRQFLSTVKLSTGMTLEKISNELMQDVWPKTNKWRDMARLPKYPEEINPKMKKAQEAQLDRLVNNTIKKAGESLSKRQISQIRKAAIVYRDFDSKEQEELDFRSDHAAKLVKLVSFYEATNKMDELICMRLAIAFCTKRRDYFLEYRPHNFMQFSYMYIYLLERVNSRIAIICACLNQQSTLGSEFDELEELLLNLFHEDYFLEMRDA